MAGSIEPDLRARVRGIGTNEISTRLNAQQDTHMNVPLENNPIRHMQKIKAQMRMIISQLREDAGKVTEARARALFGTSVKMLAGLVTAYEDYEKESRTALRNKLMESLPKGRANHATRR